MKYSREKIRRTKMNEPSELATTLSRPLCIEARAIAIAAGDDEIPQEPSAVISDYTHSTSQRSNLTYSMYVLYPNLYKFILNL